MKEIRAKLGETTSGLTLTSAGVACLDASKLIIKDAPKYVTRAEVQQMIAEALIEYGRSEAAQK